MPVTLRAIVVDDEPIARQLLRSLLMDYEADETFEVVAECASAQDAVDAIHEFEPDVVFLDVEMPGGDGFSVVEAIGPENMPVTVFATAYGHYALQAFDVVATDYLLKPFDEDRLEKTLKRVGDRVAQRDGRLEQRILDLLEELRGRGRFATRVAVESGRHMIFIPTASVDRIEAKGKESHVHAGGTVHVMREGLTSVEKRLDPSEFLRVHRSHIVRIERVVQIHRWFRGDYYLVLEDGTKLTTGRTYKKDVEDTLLGEQRPPT